MEEWPFWEGGVDYPFSIFPNSPTTLPSSQIKVHKTTEQSEK